MVEPESRTRGSGRGQPIGQLAVNGQIWAANVDGVLLRTTERTLGADLAAKYSPVPRCGPLDILGFDVGVIPVVSGHVTGDTASIC